MQLDNDLEKIDDRLKIGGNVQNDVSNYQHKNPGNRFWDTVAILKIWNFSYNFLSNCPKALVYISN